MLELVFVYFAGYTFVFESHDARHYKTQTMRDLDDKYGEQYIKIINNNSIFNA